MAYIFKQKLQLQDLAGLEQRKKKVLVHEPEEYLSALYGHYLVVENFEVKYCPFLEILTAYSENFVPEILVFNIDSGQNADYKTRWLAGFKKDFPQMPVITTGLNTSAEFLKKLMSAGTSSHINRRLTRPQDLAVLALTLIEHNN